MTIIISITVKLAPIFQLQKLLEKHILHSGTCKNNTDSFTTLTPKQQHMLQAILDDSYMQFITLVAREHNLTIHEAINGQMANFLLINRHLIYD